MSMYPPAYGTECRKCDHYVQQVLPDVNPQANNEGVHLTCAQCSTTNWCTPEEND